MALAGIPVISLLVPQNGAPIPTHSSVFGVGGWKSVATNDERDTIPMSRRMAGMTVYVVNTKSMYILQPDLETWDLRLTGSNAIDLTTDATTAIGSSLVWDGQKFVVGQATGVGDFSPTITNVQDGDVITYDVATHKWINKAPSVSGFTPVITNVQSADILMYDSVSGHWVNAVLPVGFKPTITNVQDGDILRYDSTAGHWVNVPLPAGSGFSPTITNPQAGDVLQYNATTHRWENAQPAAFPTVFDMGVI